MRACQANVPTGLRGAREKLEDAHGTHFSNERVGPVWREE